MKKRFKKAFTLVELLVVIAILAVLSTVAVVGYNSFTEKAKVSNDKGLVAQLNKLLQADEVTDGKAKTPSDALEVVVKDGFDVKKIVATADDYDIVWNEESNRFVLLDDNKVAVVEELSDDAYKNWKFSNDVSSVETNGFSIYLNDKFAEPEVTVTSGLDVGNNKGVIVNYETEEPEQVIIKTNGGALNIKAPNATVNHYGSSDSVYVEDVADSTYNLFGEAKFIEVVNGEHVVIQSTAKVNAIYVDAATTTNVEINNGATGIVYDTNGIVDDNAKDKYKEDIKAGATLFAGGLGTESSPYLIENVEQLSHIGDLYEKGFYNYKVVAGVGTLDLSRWGEVKLNGNFDGNGVKLINLTQALFLNVGYQNEDKNIKISNIDATMNSTNGLALVKYIFNSGTTTFENVHIHGYIEGSYNLGSFYNYGTASYDAKGADYTVNFVNSTSDATLVCTTGNTIGGLIGHGYEGVGNKLTINVDENSYYDGTMYVTNGAAGRKLMATCSNYKSQVSFILNGKDTSYYDEAFNYTTKKIETVSLTKGDAGYTVAVQPNVSKIVVTINCQLSVYDANGDKIANQSGITWVVSKFEIIDFGEEEVVFDSQYESATIVNGDDKECSVAVVNNVLTLYTGQNINYQTGTITLYVMQYDVNGNIIAVGSSTLANI